MGLPTVRVSILAPKTQTQAAKLRRRADELRSSELVPGACVHKGDSAQDSLNSWEAYSHKVQQQDSELAHLRPQNSPSVSVFGGSPEVVNESRDQLHELRKTLQLAETERDLQPPDLN